MPRDTGREDRILTLARALYAEKDALPLDTIDGEFYWRICQEPVARLLEHYTEPLPPELGPRPVPPAVFWERLQWLRAREQVWAAFTYTHAALLEPVPDAVLHYLRLGDRVPMRPPTVWMTEAHPLFPNTLVYVLEVHTGEWTGREVTKVLEREMANDPFLASWQDIAADTVVARFGEEAILCQMTAFLHREKPRPGARWSDWRPKDFPCIDLVLPLPVPDASLVAQFYDLRVRHQRRWHEHLPGGRASNQQKHVAIRTWAIGLLQATGRTFHQALDAVLDLCEKDDLTQSCHGDDRRVLLQRVPEARPYVFSRQPAPPHQRPPHLSTS
ncbi:MAG: hypothetical protein U0Z70_20615 [Thermomicrobiales bacterium]